MEDVKSERRSSIVRAQRRKTTNPNRMAAKRLQFGLSDHDASSSSPPSSGSSSEEDAAGAEKHGEDQEEAEALECRKLNPTSAEEEEEVINTCSAMEQQPQESTLPKPVLQFCRREPSSGSAHTSAVIETPRILKRALPKFGHWDEPHSKIGARNSFVGHDFEIPETPLPRRGSGAVSHFHQAKVVEGVEKMEIAPRVELFSAPACLPVPRRPVSAAARVPPLHGFDSSPEMCRAPDDDLKSHREKRIRAAQERRRRSAPGGGASSPTTSTPGMYRRNIEAVRVSMKENRVANINPFTPRLSLSDISANLSGSLEGSGDKRSAVAAAPHAVLVGTKSFQEEEERQASGCFTPTTNNNKGDLSLDELNRQLLSSQNKKQVLAIQGPESPKNPSKRMRVSDIHLSRYHEEFVVISKVAEGSFGTVYVAKHRLDGMLYALKCTKKELFGGAEEKSAMNEVFALAALPKHKNIIRYYSSWVEKGRIWIQNEYCQGGSLAALIQKRRDSGEYFSEYELKRIIMHLAKGLSYIHGNRLVHMDIKPENIFLSQGETSAHSSINTSGDDLSSDSKSPKDQDKCVVVPSNLNVSSSSSSITPIPSADNNDDDRIHDVADHHSISDAAVASTSSPADKGLRQSTPIEEEPAATAGKSAAVDVASAVPTSVACSSPRPSQLISMSSPKMTPVMKQKAAGERSLPPLPKFLFQSPKNNKLITSIGKKTPIRALQSTPKHMSHGAAQLMSHHSPRGGSAGVELMQHSPRPGSSTSSVSLPQLRTPGGGNDSSKVWDDSTDSGMQSSEGGKTSSPLNDFVFKIGDLGHISSVENLRDIEEGDCRYLAPELLKDQEYKHSDLLSRADIFSLGITLFECASLLHIPKNSGEKDGDFFEQLQRGELPYLERYSRDFNELLKKMVNPHVASRVSAERIVKHQFLKYYSSKTKKEQRMKQEIKEYRKKIEQLEQQVTMLRSSSSKSEAAASSGSGVPPSSSGVTSEGATSGAGLPAEPCPAIIMEEETPMLCSEDGAPPKAKKRLTKKMTPRSNRSSPKTSASSMMILSPEQAAREGDEEPESETTPQSSRFQFVPLAEPQEENQS